MLSVPRVDAMISWRRSRLLALLALLVPLAGCEPTPSEPTPPPVPPTAEERFENIVTVLREKVESNDLRTYAAVGEIQSGPNLPHTSWSTKLSHELIAAEGDGPMRALVSIVTKSEVTVVLPQNDKGSQKRNEGKKTVEVLENLAPELVELAKAASGPPSRVGSSSIKTLPDEDVSRYEFEYRDGLWVVTTPLDMEKEPFTASAIEFALRRQ